MNKIPTETAPQSQSTPAADVSDSRIVDHLRDYQAALEAGRAPERQKLLAQFPQLQETLADCLDAIELVYKARLDLSDASHPGWLPGAGQPPEALGDFHIIREIGRGGMGIVYEAEERSLGRRVALKILPFASLLSENQLQRFKNEARAAATLKHPNIVSVYSVGVERGVNYYAMELIEGASLAEANAEKAERGERKAEQTEGNPRFPLSTFRFNDTVAAALSTQRDTNPREFFQSVARLGVQLAEALDHAHEQGIIHRDIKPGNILLDRESKPWITDFGLARLEADASMTMTGDFLGTLRYMSPEQARGDRTIDHRTDVYSLGITLYELATGQPAFGENDRQRLLRQIEEQDPRPPRQLNANLPPDLETIILKAIEKQPSDRYDSASDLAEDLRRFLEHRPILACRPRFIAQGRKLVRRHPSTVVAAILVLTGMLLASILATGVAKAEKRKTVSALDEKTDALSQAKENLEVANQQRVLARRNLKKAIDTVDRMYVNFVKDWLSNSTHLSTVQFKYLNDAKVFYRDLATDLAGDNEMQWIRGVAYSRIGEIEYFLQRYRDAVRAWQHAVDVGEAMLVFSPDGESERNALVHRYMGFGDSLQKLGRLDKADRVFEKGLSYAEGLRKEHPEVDTYQVDVARYQLRLGSLLTTRQDLDAAETAISAARKSLLSLQTKPESPQEQILAFESGRLLSRVHWGQDRLKKALNLAQATLAKCRSLRMKTYSDLRPILSEEVRLTVLVGDLHMASGELPTAIDNYRSAIALKLRTLRAKLDPVLFDYSYQSGTVSWDAHWEPGPFVEYIEIEQRLAKALRALGKPHAAEIALGNCLYPSAIIDDIEQGLIHGVAQANSAALAAQLLTDIRPDDAAILRAQAVNEWCRVLGNYPHAANYISGVNGLETDLNWFRRIFPDEIVAPRPPQKEDAHQYGINAGEGTVFLVHTGAHQAYRAEDFGFAAKTFLKSATMRKSDHEFDWLYLAMAHAQLGNVGQSKAWMSKANAAIDAREDTNAELINLRDDARSLISQLAKHHKE